MIDFAKYNVKELANEGIEFHFRDIKANEDIATTLVVYGSDSDNIRKARKIFNDITDNEKVTDAKKEEAMRKFLAECVKSWEDTGDNALAFGGEVIKSGDRDTLVQLLEVAPQFQGQLLEFVTDRTNFLAE